MSLYEFFQTGKMKYLYSITILSLIWGCASTQIKVNYNTKADFAKFETYGWLQGYKKIENFNRVENKKLQVKLHDLIDKEISALGYELLNEGDPDILVTYYAGVKGEVVVDDQGYSYGKWYEGSKAINQEGILVIDLIDNERQELFWRGTGSGLIDDPDRIDQEVAKIIKKIFAKFPERNREI